MSRKDPLFPRSWWADGISPDRRDPDTDGNVANRSRQVRKLARRAL